jgi:hypothetical protein
MTKFEQFKAQFPDLKCSNLFVEIDNGDRITGIDVAQDKVTYRYFYTESCGCCLNWDEDTESLSWYLDYMSEGEFEILVKEVMEQL